VTSRGRSLRVGALIDGPHVPAWVAWILRSIEAHPDLTLALVVDAAAARPRRRSLFAVYESFDRRVFPVQPDALARVDASATLAGVPHARGDDVAAIRRHDLDVLLHLGGDRPRGPILAIPRYGAWSHRHGPAPGDVPPLFHELSTAAPETQTALELLRENGSRVIYRSTASTDVVSLNRSRVPAYWKSARFALRRLEDLANGRWEPDGAEAADPPPQAIVPTATDTLRHTATVAGRVLRRKLGSAAFQHQWLLGFRRRTGDRLPQDDPAPWQLTVPPPDRSYADPFVVRHDGETFVFFEVLPHDRGIGELAVGRLEPDARLTEITPIMPVPHHTSYPYVFADGERLFLIPEFGEARRVDLFAATDFPTGWERVATLLEGVNAVDPTVYRDGDRYWMWVTIAVPGGRLQDETFLYFSDRLDGGWTPHPRNPVVSDARRARPAGRPFVHGGRLIRPSQNCCGRYGERVIFNAVERLDTEEYRERPFASLGPEWAARPNLAAHTYTFDGEWEATDGLRTFRRVLSR